MSYAKITVKGNITRLEYKSDKKVLFIGIACNQSYKSLGGTTVEKTLFFDFTAFGDRAEIMFKHFESGDPILIGGNLEMQQWEDKKTGDRRSKICGIVQDFDWCESKAAKELRKGS